MTEKKKNFLEEVNWIQMLEVVNKMYTSNKHDHNHAPLHGKNENTKLVVGSFLLPRSRGIGYEYLYTLLVYIWMFSLRGNRFVIPCFTRSLFLSVFRWICFFFNFPKLFTETEMINRIGTFENTPEIWPSSTAVS